MCMNLMISTIHKLNEFMRASNTNTQKKTEELFW